MLHKMTTISVLAVFHFLMGTTNAYAASLYDQGFADGVEFSIDNKKYGILVNKNTCLAGSIVGAANLPAGVPATEANRETYGAAVYNGCMAKKG